MSPAAVTLPGAGAVRGDGDRSPSSVGGFGSTLDRVSEASETAAAALDRPPVSPGDRRPLALRPVPPLDAVPAKRCPAGHPNDVEAVECRICRDPLDAAAAVVEVLPEPLGRFLLEDGSAAELVTDLVIGRSPAGDGDEALLTVPGRQVSRTHLRLEVRGWRLRILDLGSTNGTFVTRQGERGRRRVPEDRPVPLHIGDTVHFGSRQALIVPRGH